MYPQSLKIITTAEKEVEALRDGLRGAILALEVERSTLADIHQNFDADLQAILGLGVLLNDLQNRRTKLRMLGAALPSPNKVQPELRERVSGLGRTIFETEEHVRNIQGETYRLARLNLRAASHKLNFASKVQARATKEHLSAVA